MAGHASVKINSKLCLDDAVLWGDHRCLRPVAQVLSKPESLPPATARGAGAGDADVHVGFWRNPKRFNVAITRARALLVVVGHPVVLTEVRTMAAAALIVGLWCAISLYAALSAPLLSDLLLWQVGSRRICLDVPQPSGAHQTRGTGSAWCRL